MPVTPQMAAPAPGIFAEQTALNCEPGVPFVILVTAKAAEVREEGLKKPTWFPGVRILPISPGTQGVSIRRDHMSFKDTFRPAVRRKEEEGFIYLDPEKVLVTDPNHLPEGVQPGAYIREYPVYDRRSKLQGNLYKEAWSTRMATRSPSDPPQWRFDKASYNRWLVHLMETGVIPGPDEFARDEYLTTARTWASRQANIDDPAKRADKVKQTAAHVKSLESAAVVGPKAA